MGVGFGVVRQLFSQISNSPTNPTEQWGFWFVIIALMDKEPDDPNVHYMDEYPELTKKVWLRRLAAERFAPRAVEATTVIYLPEPPDGIA